MSIMWNGCVMPRVSFGVVRIDPLCFLAGCHKSLLNQALSVLCLSIGFLSLSVMMLTRATVCIVLFVCSVPWFFFLGCQYQCK